MKTIRNVGKVQVFSELPNGDGKIRANNFMTNLNIGFTKEVSKYLHYHVGDVPFGYREKQLHAFFTPALSRLNSLFFLEAPVDRKKAKKNIPATHGWVDYWCLYRKLIYIIELKHGYISGKNGKPNKHVLESWAQANNQLEAIGDYEIFKTHDCEGIFKIAFIVLPIYENFKNDEPKNIYDFDKLLEIRENTITDLNNIHESNWSMLWELHDTIKGNYETYTGNSIYPGVLFIANITRHHD